jgi:hypothetical protein
MAKRIIQTHFCLALVLSGGLFCTGCRGIGTQQFTAFAPAQSHELENSSRIVLDVTCLQQTVKGDYSLSENLSLFPIVPKYWKYDATLQVERVVKGNFDEKTVQLHSLREPTGQQLDSLGIPPNAGIPPDSWSGLLGPQLFTNGTPLRIGFDGRHGKQFSNLKIMVRQ